MEPTEASVRSTSGRIGNASGAGPSQGPHGLRSRRIRIHRSGQDWPEEAVHGRFGRRVRHLGRRGGGAAQQPVHQRRRRPTGADALPASEKRPVVTGRGQPDVDHQQPPTPALICGRLPFIYPAGNLNLSFRSFPCDNDRRRRTRRRRRRLL